MRPPARLRLDPARRKVLVDVAAGRRDAEVVVVGGRVLNVFTGAVASATIGIACGRVAWVGPPGSHAGASSRVAGPGSSREPSPRVIDAARDAHRDPSPRVIDAARDAHRDPSPRVIDAGGAVIVPGLIDAHSHADMLCTPDSFAVAAAAHGTTAAVVDTHTLSSTLDDASLRAIGEALETAPMKFLWAIRPSRDAGGPADAAELPLDRLRSWLSLAGVSGTGELTAWRALLAGDERLGAFVGAAIDAGLRVDGHLPGASPSTLAQLAAAGLTSDHEAITGAELAARVEVGLWTMVRHSSLRPDGVALGAEIRDRELPTARLLLTADGVLPQDLLTGHLDLAVRKVIEGGVPPVDAVRMATLNPATYLGLDSHLGAIAPGRCADLVLVDELDSFNVLAVLADGEPVEIAAGFAGPATGADRAPSAATATGADRAPSATAAARAGTARAAGFAGPGGSRPIDWASMSLPYGDAPITAAELARSCRDAPAIRLDGVVPRLAPDDGPGATLLALVARDGSWICGATTGDLPVAAVASTMTGTRDVFLAGRDPKAVMDAYRRVVAMGGGFACPGAEVPLPVLGHLSPWPIARLAAALEGFESAAGLPAQPPFAYLTTFLTLPALPGVCLTPEGLRDVKSATILHPSEPLLAARRRR